MSLAELLPEIDALNIDDKARLRDILLRDLEHLRLYEEMKVAAQTPYFGLYDCGEAAATLTRMLEERQGMP